MTSTTPRESQETSELRLERWTPSAAADAYAEKRFSNTRREQRDPRLLSALMARFPLSGDAARVLDVPSGTGRLHAVASGLGRELVAVDRSLAMLSRGAGKRLCASAWRLPFRDDCFELVLCCRLLHHLDQDQQRAGLLRELARVARERVLISYWDAACLQMLRRRWGLRRARQSDTRVAIGRARLEQLARAAGLEVLGHAASARWLSPQTFCALRPTSAPWPRSR